MSSEETSSASSQCSSASDDEEDVCFDFEIDLASYVQEVVRLGALGIFKEARHVAREYLGEHENLFPVAAEIMRLMYDQGDVVKLYDYSGRSMAESRVRMQHKSWTGRAVCILHLLRDVCGALRGNPTNVATTHLDLREANLNDAQDPEDLDDEQIFITVLMLRMIYSGYRQMSNTNIVSRRSLPPMLQRESSFHLFVADLLRRKRFWAAADVMTTCFRLANVDCAALWKSTEEFLTGRSGGNDEPTACFRLVLLQIFMEGLLCVGITEIPSGPTLWNNLRREHNNLRVLLSRRLAEDNTWENSRSCWRGKLIDFDKATFDTGPQFYRETPQVLQLAQRHATEHDDRYLADAARWRIDVVMRRADVATASYLDGALLLPFGAYSKRYNLTIVQDRSFQHRPLASLQAGRQANVASRSSGPSNSSHIHTLQSQLPWQHSGALGGRFVYKPSTDTIILESGRQLSRPAQISIASLDNAAWEGPVPGQQPVWPVGGHTLSGLASSSTRVQANQPGRGAYMGSNDAKRRSQRPGVGNDDSGSNSDARVNTDDEDEEDDVIADEDEGEDDEGDV